MELKTEWTKLINMGQAQDLTAPQLYFLLALYEVEGGSEGNEFNIKDVQNTTFDQQAVSAICSIKANDVRWQRYIREQSYMDFTSFFVYLGGPYGKGWHNNTKKGVVKQLNKLTEEIENEFTGDSSVGEEH
jgi:hypothetical protein